MTWMTSMNRKKHQRAMNKIVRVLNKNLEEDELWKGRFYVRQVASRFQTYSDKSGAELFVILRLYDKETKLTKDVHGFVNSWRFLNGYDLWRAMNDFIVEYVEVWRNVQN